MFADVAIVRGVVSVAVVPGQLAQVGHAVTVAVTGPFGDGTDVAGLIDIAVFLQGVVMLRTVVAGVAHAVTVAVLLGQAADADLASR